LKQITINNFSGGLNTFFSPRDIPDNQFQKFSNINNEKVGRIGKFKGTTIISPSVTIHYSTLTPQGNGFYTYKTQYDESTQTPATWWVVYTSSKSSATTVDNGGSISDVATSFDVTSVSNLTENSYILIDSEVMFISGISGVTLTVTRGQLGTTAATHNDLSTVYELNWTFSRMNADDGVSATVSSFMTQKTGGDWTGLQYTALPDYYSIYEGLRISDGEFRNSNTSKWYGYIKRDIWGNALSYGDNEFPNYYKPSQATQYGNWLVADQQITAPTIVKMGGAYDPDNDVDSDGKVGIFVYDARQNYSGDELDDHDFWPNAIDGNVFSVNDRYAFTFVYDYVQESGLSKDADGMIGVSGFNVIDSDSDEYLAQNGTVDNLVNGAIAETDGTITVDNGSTFKQHSYIRIDDEIMYISSISGNVLTVRRGTGASIYSEVETYKTTATAHVDDSKIYIVPTKQKARALSVVLYVGSNWNHRITGINIYWQPEGDMDWYWVDQLDVEKGYTRSQSAVFNRSIKMAGTKNNYGAWTRIPSHSIREPAVGTIGAGSSETTWYSTGYFTNTVAGDIAIGTPTEFGNTYSDMLNTLNTMFGKIDTVPSSDSITFSSSLKPTSRISWRSSTPGAAATPHYVATAQPAPNKLGVWYIPFDGAKTATYKSLTGREDSETIDPVRWKTSCVTEKGVVFIGNVDTLDENSQTVREESRVMWTVPGMPDVFDILRSYEFGKSDGDSIVALVYWNGRVFVFKDRSTYIYNVSSQNYFIENHYAGYGILSKNAYAITPYGIVVADKSRVVLHSGQEPIELSYPWRKSVRSGYDSYQGLTFTNPVLGYSPNQNAILFIPDTTASTLYKYDFDTKSWVTQTTDSSIVFSNLLVDSNMETCALEHSTGNDKAVVREFDTGSLSSSTATIKTKQFDGGNPDRYKKLKRVYLTYKTSSSDSGVNTTSALNTSETDVYVDDVTNFSAGMYIKIDSEIMLVNSVTTTVSPAGYLTVTRAQAGTIAASHSATDVYWCANDVTVKIYFDGGDTAHETLTYNGCPSMITLGKDSFSTEGKFKTIEVEVSTTDSGFALDDLRVQYFDMGIKT